MASSTNSGTSSTSIVKKEAPTTGREVALISSDGEKYFVPPSVVRTSRVLGKKLKDLANSKSKGAGSGSGSGAGKGWDKSFTLEQISSQTLEQIIQWGMHHKGRMQKLDGKPVALTTPWDQQFVSELERDDIFKLSLAAKDLEIEGLLELMCAEIAKMLAGKTPEQVRSEFGVVNDFTPEEEEAIRLENELLFGITDSAGSSDGEERRALEWSTANSNTPALPAPTSEKKETSVSESDNDKLDSTWKLKPSPLDSAFPNDLWFQPSETCRCLQCTRYYRAEELREERERNRQMRARERELRTRSNPNGSNAK